MFVFPVNQAIALILAFCFSSQCIYAAWQDTDAQVVDGVTFTVPRGVTIEKVASSPLVERPIVAAWDHLGRLLVLEAAGPVERENESQGSRPHRLVRLVDDDRDGRFDRRIVAAEELSFPVGVLAVDTHRVLVSAPPEIWMLIDDDGDGVCERREVWFDPGTATHCYNDLHGPYLGRDGWIYWTKGAFATQAFALRDGQPFPSTAAHIYRRRIDGGPIEAVMTGGMDNPVELAFTPEGERFFTSTFLQFPGGGKRDGIAHAIYGGLYGKEHDVLNNHWATGNLLPIMTHLGPAAPSGLTLLERPDLLEESSLQPQADQAELKALLVAQFNLQKVSLHRLVPDGSTFRTIDQTLLSTDWVQFHPTDVLEDRDGSLLVFDTGGWYDLCCPSLAIDQSVAVGGIYRLHSPTTRAARAKTRNTPPDLTSALEQFAVTSAWEKRIAGDWLVAHAEIATKEISERLNDAKQPLRLRQDLLWLLCQIGNEFARTKIVEQLKASESELRQTAAMAIAVHRWPEAGAVHTALKAESNPATIRVLAETIGRMGDRSSVPLLMETIARCGPNTDRILQHSLYYALIELNQSEAIAQYLHVENPNQVAAALRALHERGDFPLEPSTVIPALNSSASRETALTILLAHPEWSSGLGELLPEMFMRAIDSPGDRQALLAISRNWGAQPAFQQLIAVQLDEANPENPKLQGLLVELIPATRLENLPAEWSDGLGRLIDQLASANAAELPLILNWLGSLPLSAIEHSSLISSLLTLGLKQSPNALTALAALPRQTKIPDEQLEGLVKTIEASDSSETSRAIWLALQRLQIDPPRLERLADTSDKWDLSNIALAVQLLAEQASPAINLKVLKQLEQNRVAKSISPDQLREIYRPRGEQLLNAAEALLSHLAAPTADVGPAVDNLLNQLPTGDPLRGLQVFRSTQAACSSCHQIAYVGGQVGPDLSRIGATRTQRELLEAIAYPSARQEQSYRAEKFALTDGRIVSGLVESREGDSLMVRTGIDQRVRFRIDEIEQRLPSDLSIMPAGIIDALSPQQLADLLAFLESRR